VTKKVAVVSYPIYHSYKLQPFLRKRLKAEQILILDLSDYVGTRGGDFRIHDISQGNRRL
jgi:hypothetical protein